MPGTRATFGVVDLRMSQAIGTLRAMGRARRQDPPGAIHHLMNRGTARTMLFRSDEDRGGFMYRVGCLESRFALEVHAFVLMGNHYHVIVRSLEGRLSEAMHWLGTHYARRFNRAHGRDGAFFKSRFESELIETDEYLARAGAYVHLNPFKAGLVEQIGSYRWSSLGAYAGRRRAMPWLHTELLRGSMSPDAYFQMVCAYAGEVIELDTPDDASGVGWYRDIEGAAAAAVTRADEQIAGTFGVSVDDLYAVRRGVLNIPRLVALAYSTHVIGLDSAQAAKRYGLKNGRSVRSARQRLRALVSEDPTLSQTLETLRLGASLGRL